MSLATFCRSQSKPTLLALAVSGALIVGWVDYATGYEISFFLFYGGPILFAVWFLDRKSTALVVLLSAIVWWWADWQDGHPYFASWVQVWETMMRLAFFSFVAVGGTAIRSRRESIEASMEDMKRMRVLERDIVAAIEKEQQRIGADLHDGLCQYLAGILCATGSLQEDLAERYLPEAETAAEIHELVRGAITQARDIARGIAPVHMDEAGLASALEDLAATMRRLHGVECEFESEGMVLVTRGDIAVHLYRIAQEACSNAVRHGRATVVTIRLAVGDARMTLSVDDNGHGVDQHEGTSIGMGLRTMRYRAGVLGGALEVGASPGGGTRICCQVPITAAAVAEEMHAS